MQSARHPRLGSGSLEASALLRGSSPGQCVGVRAAGPGEGAQQRGGCTRNRSRPDTPGELRSTDRSRCWRLLGYHCPPLVPCCPWEGSPASRAALGEAAPLSQGQALGRAAGRRQWQRGGGRTGQHGVCLRSPRAHLPDRSQRASLFAHRSVPRTSGSRLLKSLTALTALPPSLRLPGRFAT